ncbi:ATPase family AAA domain-containing protein 2 [Papilio xuthus]|uniref:ATPase family AAA domain-containing protein 2 n=1 Tax=Papilio xuthus TaxID=66420 RepID=A0A194Q4A3_PAPXU|nr:ATPase family AAA domain-containing protein 2 [Papilio xuthus]
MVKTRRSNGENGEVEDGNFTLNDVVSVSDEKASNWSPRELRSSQYKVKRKIQHWPTKYSRNRLRRIRMPQIVFPESDTEPEKYSRRSRQVRVFFADDNESSNRSMQIRRNRGPRKNYMEDSEDKPIQQNVRRSCRKRKLLHHNFNESWITNELKVKGYPDLYGFNGSSSSDEFSSGDEAVVTNKKMPQNHIPTNIDEDTQLSRQRRTSARFNNKKDATESESEDENNQTVIEKKPQQENKQEQKDIDDKEDVKKTINKSDPEQSNQNQDSESNQGPARSTRGKGRGRRRQKKEDSQHDTASESSSSESSSELALGRQPRRSKRTRKPKPAFVQIAPRETKGRGNTFTIRKKPYSLRERKPKILRRKTIRSQSPSTSSSSSTSSSDTEEDLNVSMKNKTKGRQKSKSMDDKKTDRALRDIQPVELDGKVRFTSVSYSTSGRFRRTYNSKRTRKPKPAFVQIAPRETKGRAQSPSTSSSSSTSSSDTEEDLNVSMKNKTKGRQKSKSMDDKKTDRALRDIQPVELDGKVRFTSVGGLEEHIKCLREMVLFPLMYPDLFNQFKTRPAKGVLFHGPPGTGKTLLARALANECSLVGGRKVAFFMRKGADCLKKWVGESERHLKLLFQQEIVRFRVEI